MMEMTSMPKDEVVIYRSELDYIRRAMMDFPEEETGGELFMTYMPDGRMVVAYVLGCGPDAFHSPAFFRPDIDYLKRVGGTIASAYALTHGGSWHRHPPGMPCPSSHDSFSVRLGMNVSGRERWLLGIGLCDEDQTCLNAYMYSYGSPEPRPVCFRVLMEESPYRRCIDEALAGVLEHPGEHSDAPEMTVNVKTIITAIE